MFGLRFIPEIILRLRAIAAAQTAQSAQLAAIIENQEKTMGDVAALNTSIANLTTQFNALMKAETDALAAAHAADDSAGVNTAISNINALTQNMTDALTALTPAAPVVTQAAATSTLSP